MKTKKLQQYVVTSWLISAAMAIVASFLLFFLFGLYSYNQEIKLVQNTLESKTQVLARRISGELLIAPRGAPTAVALQLQKELNLSDVQFGSSSDIEKISKNKNLAYVILPIPFLETKYSVIAALPKVQFTQHLNLVVLIVSFILIGVIVGTGLFLQTRYLKKHIIKPIEALVDTSTGKKHVCENWPQELQEISEKLSSSFQEREQVVYNQIARGVIHDIKTILQSLQIAVDLAYESPSENRLQNLLKVSKSKLPSLLEIIDTTLDGSREISVSRKKSDLMQTVQRSIDTTKMLGVAQNVNISLQSASSELILAHDSVQLERVFTNLLKNAFEAVSEKDENEKQIKVSFKLDDKNFVQVDIEDSGVGLPKQPESIFRLLKSTKNHGSGLGLRVSRKIVEAHNGTLTAMQSSELKGAKFEVKIPLEVQI